MQRNKPLSHPRHKNELKIDQRPKKKVKVLVALSSLTLCDPMDYNPPGSPVHGLLQARIQGW